MDWEFLSEISADLDIPIVQPYNRIITNKESFYDSYIKIDNEYVEFIDGLGLSYSDFLYSTAESRTEKHNDKPVIADLTDIMKQLMMDMDYIRETLSTILDLFILGRLHHRNTKPVSKLRISKRVIFPVLYLLNILGAKYHVDALITYTLVDIYNKIFERKFYGYTKDDRQNIRFYLTILINFESSNTEIIYRFLRQNSEHSRLIDLLGVIKDYMAIEYYEEVSDIIKKLMIANNDRYIIIQAPVSIHFLDKYGIIDRRQPILKPASQFSDDDKLLIIYNAVNYQLPPLNMTKIITPQMLQDRLPLDINRDIYITLEGAITAILYPIIKLCFDRNARDSIDFCIYFINSNVFSEYSNIYRIQLNLTGDSLKMTLTALSNDEILDTTSWDTNKVTDFDLNTHLINIASNNSEILVSIELIEFQDIYPELTKHVYDILEDSPPKDPKEVKIIDYLNEQPYIPSQSQHSIKPIVKKHSDNTDDQPFTQRSITSPRPSLSNQMIIKRDSGRVSPRKTKYYPSSPRCINPNR